MLTLSPRCAAAPKRHGLQGSFPNRPSCLVSTVSVTFVTSEGAASLRSTSPMLLTQPAPAYEPGDCPQPRLRSRKPAEQEFGSDQPLARFNAEASVVRRDHGHEIVWMRAADNRHHTVSDRQRTKWIAPLQLRVLQLRRFQAAGEITLDAQGRFLVWEIGRHGAGDNLFAYYIDLPVRLHGGNDR